MDGGQPARYSDSTPELTLATTVNLGISRHIGHRGSNRTDRKGDSRLATGRHPDESTLGVVLAIVSLVVMPLLARAKRRVGEQLHSRAVTADATETTLCVYLSAILLSGLVLNATLGWWWADPIAGLAIVAIAAREGIEHWRADELDHCCA